jgi:hypothetical protein
MTSSSAIRGNVPRDVDFDRIPFVVRVNAAIGAAARETKGVLMRYLLTIFEDEANWAGYSPEEGKAMLDEYFAFGEAAREAGVFVGGEGLQPSATATTVRVRDGESAVTDGPFAETKEQLGGYYLLDCKDLDDAISWAERIPGARAGAIEVRPVMDYEAMQSGAGAAQEAARS